MTLVPTSAILAALIFEAAAIAPAQVAVGAMPSTIAVLRTNGEILLGGLDDPSGVLRPIATDYDVVTDMSAGPVNGSLAIFVAGTLRSPTRGIVRWYSQQGKEVKMWVLFNAPLAGIAFDSTAGLIYAGGRNRTIYPIRIEAEAMGTPLIVTGLNLAGSIAVDSARHRIFVADITYSKYSKVFVMDLNTKATREVARNLGTVSALAFDGSSGILYISDAEGRLLKLNPESNTRPTEVAIGMRLREPLGLAILPGGDLLVGDRAANLVSRIHPTGELVRQFR